MSPAARTPSRTAGREPSPMSPAVSIGVRRGLALCAGLLMLTAPASGDEATYAMRGPLLPGAVEVNGYRQTVTGSPDGWVRVTVVVQDDPLGSSSTWAHPAPRPGVPEGFALPRGLATGLASERTAWAAAGRVLDWVRARVRHDETDTEAQDAASVLGRRRARCSGIANLSAALLMASGFEARTVSGLLIGDNGAAIPHRWLECRIPDVGWVPTDPTLGRWMITPRHVAFDRAVATLPEVRVLESDLQPPRSRVNRGAELSCRLVGSPPPEGGVALLRGPDGQRREVALEPAGLFSGLKPGRWVLEVRIAGMLLERHALTLEDEIPVSLAIPVPHREEAGS